MKKRSVRNTRAKGTRFERVVIEHLENKGFFVVRQAASAFPDLIAIKPFSLVYFIECKVGKNGLPSEEKFELIRIARKYGAIAQFAKPLKTLKNCELTTLC